MWFPPHCGPVAPGSGDCKWWRDTRSGPGLHQIPGQGTVIIGGKKDNSRLSRYRILEIEMESFRIQSCSLWVVLYRSVSQRLDTFFFEETKYYYVKFFSILWYIQIWYKQLISGFLIIIEKNPDLKIQLSFKPSSLSLYSCAVIGEVILFISYFMEADERRIYHFQFMIKGFIIFILW